MARREIEPWDWLKRTSEPIPGEAALNECLGATIVVTSIHENGDLEAVVLPGGPHDTNGRGGQFVSIKAEHLVREFFTPRSPRLCAHTEAA